MNADARGLSDRAVHVAGILRGVAEETIDGMDRMTWRAALLAAARIVEEDDNRRITEAPAPTDAREALARVETAALPLIKYLNGMDAFYGDEPYDTEDVIDTASGDRGDTAALRWSDLRDLRAALAPSAADAGQRDTQERGEEPCLPGERRTALATSLRGTPPVLCESCGHEIEAWCLISVHGLSAGHRWRHVASGAAKCWHPRWARPYDGFAAERQIRADREAQP